MSSVLQGDGDYELAKDVIFDDYLLKRIAKVSFPYIRVVLEEEDIIFFTICFQYPYFLILQTEAELLAEKRCVAHLTGEVNLSKP